MHQIINGGLNNFYSTDYRHTHNILGAADIVISPLSTILIEGLCHGKDGICLIPKEEDKGILSEIWRSLPCFQDVIKSPGIKAIESLNDLEDALYSSIINCKKDDNFKKNKAFASFFVDMENPSYQDRLINCVSELVNK